MPGCAGARGSSASSWPDAMAHRGRVRARGGIPRGGGAAVARGAANRADQSWGFLVWYGYRWLHEELGWHDLRLDVTQKGRQVHSDAP